MFKQHPDILYWLAAMRLEGIGPIRIKKWFDQLGDIKNIFSGYPKDLDSITPKQIDALKNVNFIAAERDLIWAQEKGCQLITINDDYYPALLKEIPDAPLLLYVLGDAKLLAAPQLAIVGSRNPTPVGKKAAEQFAYCLSQNGIVITSGLALGIDSASHRGALLAVGETIAVCGTGLAHMYPASNQKLAEEIQQKGAIISEFPPDTPPRAKHFPMRNRLISGLSLGVLVIEAALRSGSLITARFANEQGRDVFALPGSIHNPLARGCHYLIRQGAKLVETAQDILEELGNLRSLTEQRPLKSQKLTAKQEFILTQIGYEITALDAIIVRSGLTAGEVSSMLLVLELEGYVKIAPGGYLRNP